MLFLARIIRSDLIRTVFPDFRQPKWKSFSVSSIKLCLVHGIVLFVEIDWTVISFI